MKWFLGSFAVLFVLALASCGHQYCVMGFGDCDAMFSGAAQASGTGGGGTLSITAPQSYVYMTKTLQLNASGGQAPISQVNANPASCASVDTKTWLLTPGSIAGLCTLEFRDGSPTPQDVTVNITIKALGT